MKTECYFKVNDFDIIKDNFEIIDKIEYTDFYFDNRKNDDKTSFVIVRKVGGNIDFIYNNIEPDLQIALASFIATNHAMDIPDVIEYLDACYFAYIGMLNFSIEKTVFRIVDQFDVSVDFIEINNHHKFIKAMLSHIEDDEKTADLCISCFSRKFDVKEEVNYLEEIFKILEY